MAEATERQETRGASGQIDALNAITYGGDLRASVAACRRPYSIAVDGAPWTIATDACVLAAVGGEVAEPNPAAGDGPTVVLRAALDARGTPIDVPALRAFCGEPPPAIVTPCPRCGREARHSDWRTGVSRGGAVADSSWCETCDNDGWLFQPPRRVIVRGGTLDANPLARALACVDGGAVASWAYAPVKGGQMFALRGEGWVIALMALSGGGGTPFRED